jgi:hypothetical protein
MSEGRGNGYFDTHKCHHKMLLVFFPQSLVSWRYSIVSMVSHQNYWPSYYLCRMATHTHNIHSYHVASFPISRPCTYSIVMERALLKSTFTSLCFSFITLLNLLLLLTQLINLWCFLRLLFVKNTLSIYGTVNWMPLCCSLIGSQSLRYFPYLQRTIPFRTLSHILKGFSLAKCQLLNLHVWCQPFSKRKYAVLVILGSPDYNLHLPMTQTAVLLQT